MKRWIFLSLSFFMIPVILLAQDEYPILDPNSNKSIHYDTKYIEKQIDKLNIYEPVFILYPVIKNQNQEKIINKINQRIEDIVLKQLTTDSFKTKIIEHYKRQLIFARQKEYLKMVEEQEEYGDYEDEEEQEENYRNYEYYAPPLPSDYYEKTPVVFSLKEVDFEFLSYSDPILATIAKFVYVVKNPDTGEVESLNFFQPYYFNVFSGKEFLPEQLLKNSSSEILTTLIKDKIYANENLMKDPEQRIPENKNTYSFQLGKGSYFWFDLSSFSGHLINSLNGDEFTLSFSPEEIKPFLNPVGPYAHFISFKTPVNTLYKNLNYPDYQEKRARRFFNPFPVIDGIPENYKSKNLKEIQINVIKNTSDKKAEEVISKKYLFNEKGLVTAIEIYDDGHSYGKMVFSYNERNLISKKVYLNYGEVQTEITYEYDKNNNLIREKSIYNGNEFNETKYTYGNNYFDKGNTSFKERYYLDSAGNVIKFLSRYSDANYFYQTNYRYDASFRLIASYSYNQSPLQGYLYAYNKNGKLLSLEYDNQRYRSEYAYDTLGNCIEEVKYDGIHGGSRIGVEYNSDNMPSKYSEGDKMFVIHYYYR